jgi:hypothetical protein
VQKFRKISEHDFCTNDYLPLSVILTANIGWYTIKTVVNDKNDTLSWLPTTIQESSGIICLFNCTVSLRIIAFNATNVLMDREIASGVPDRSFWPFFRLNSENKILLFNLNSW